jgi:hypothetical protein
MSATITRIDTNRTYMRPVVRPMPRPSSAVGATLTW